MSQDKSTTMTTDTEHKWHPLPALIGRALTADEDTTVMCGGYLVTRVCDGSLAVYEEIDRSDDIDDLPAAGHVTQVGDIYVAAESVGQIHAPEGGWDGEIEPVSKEYWDGYR